MRGNNLGNVEFSKPGEACGVFGIYGPDLPLAELTIKGLHALDHRGQQGAGISVSDGTSIYLTNNLGSVKDVFPNDLSLSGLLNPTERLLATGQTLYSTSANTLKKRDSLQPMFFAGKDFQFTLAHNGNLPDLSELVDEYGINIQRSASDTHVLLQILGAEHAINSDLRSTLRKVLPKLIGAYSLVLSTPTEILAARDPQGFRPLHLGRHSNKGWVVASETAALDIVGADPYREVRPGEIVVINSETDKGLSYEYFADEQPALCGFEYVYFSRPDNEMYGEVTLKVRERMGELLAIGDNVEADMVIGIPNSGLSAADGYARSRGMLHEKALVRNNSIPRTFIKPNDQERLEAIHNKLNPIKRLIKGKRLIVVDDSIVRGNTMKAVVAMFKEAGAEQVHLRISSPPYISPCFYGMDTGKWTELIAARMSVNEICEFVGVDSLKFLTNEQMQIAVGAAAGKICTACTTSIYPTDIPIKLLPSKQMDLALINA